MFDLLLYDARANAADHRIACEFRARAIDDKLRLAAAEAQPDGIRKLVFDSLAKRSPDMARVLR